MSIRTTIIGLESVPLWPNAAARSTRMGGFTRVGPGIQENLNSGEEGAFVTRLCQRRERSSVRDHISRVSCDGRFRISEDGRPPDSNKRTQHVADYWAQMWSTDGVRTQWTLWKVRRTQSGVRNISPYVAER